MAKDEKKKGGVKKNCTLAETKSGQLWVKHDREDLKILGFKNPDIVTSRMIREHLKLPVRIPKLRKGRKTVKLDEFENMTDKEIAEKITQMRKEAKEAEEARKEE